MPFVTALLTGLGIAAAGAGVGESVNASGQASNSAQANQNIANQELQDKQQIFQQLQPYYSQYLQNGSPYLQNIQRQGAEQNAQQYNNSAGQLRQTMNQSGLGYGPSGTTASALGQIGTQSANQSSNTYLSNLLNNEQVKFQAAQGLSGLGNMMSGQNTVGATPQPVQSTVGSSVNALGQVLGNTSGQNTGQIPIYPNPYPLPTNPATPASGGISPTLISPPTQGFTL